MFVAKRRYSHWMNKKFPDFADTCTQPVTNATGDVFKLVILIPEYST